MGYDERVELGDTGLTMENGAIKDENGEPVKKKRGRFQSSGNDVAPAETPEEPTDE